MQLEESCCSNQVLNATASLESRCLDAYHVESIGLFLTDERHWPKLNSVLYMSCMFYCFVFSGMLTKLGHSFRRSSGLSATVLPYARWGCAGCVVKASMPLVLNSK